MLLIKKIFIKSPLFFKKILINLEALRRDYYRRWGNYAKLLSEINEETFFKNDYFEKQNKLFIELLTYAVENVPAYKEFKYIWSLNDISKLSILNKKELINNIDYYISKEVKKTQLNKYSTSGSTGKPLTFYKDRESIRYNFAYRDKMYEIVGLDKKDIICRFSGISLFEFNKKTSPYWVYINRYRQLQCSSYHLNESNFKLYIDAMIEHGVTFGTGYANTWLFLAEYILKHQYTIPDFKAIVTDSEGFTNEQQDIVEKAFKCQVYQTYGLGEVGQIAFQCKNRNYHIIPQAAFVEIVDKKHNSLKQGETGQILVTNLYSKKTPFIRYATGDMGSLKSDKCSCGWNTPYLSEITGRIDDYILINDGRKVGRLSHIMKPAKGVISSQLVQVSINSLIINIIPDNNFDENSMTEVIKNAKNYLGNMNIKWRVVDKLEHTSNGKIRHVIRKI